MPISEHNLKNSVLERDKREWENDLIMLLHENKQETFMIA